MATDELTTKMHAEFSVDEETEIKHKAMCIWNYNLYKTDAEIKDACKSYGITYEQALEYRDSL